MRDTVYEMLTADTDERVCRDIPEAACREQPRNFLIHVASLALTKTGDGLADPKIVLSWLLGTLGAPAYLIGTLVPIREAGALLPQLFTAAGIRSLPRRKWAWAAGSVVQGISVIVMGVAALAVDGAPAGWIVVGALAVFSLARSVCSVSYKDVLGKTVSKSRRGTATGLASTLSAALVLAYGIGLGFGIIPKSVSVVATVILIAGGAWLCAAALFSALAEEPGATEGGGKGIEVALAQFSSLRTDPQLSLFIAVRSLLVATALAPPYLLALGGLETETGFGELGLFVIASSLAAIVSTYVWGRLADVSSRKVLILSGVAASVALGVAAALGGLSPAILDSRFAAPIILFALMIAYQGVRLGRSTHIVDMADEQTRASYTALSNTIVGIVLIAGSAFGAVAHYAGVTTVLVLFTAMSALAALLAVRLDEVQKTT